MGRIGVSVRVSSETPGGQASRPLRRMRGSPHTGRDQVRDLRREPPGEPAAVPEKRQAKGRSAGDPRIRPNHVSLTPPKAADPSSRPGTGTNRPVGVIRGAGDARGCPGFPDHLDTIVTPRRAKVKLPHIGLGQTDEYNNRNRSGAFILVFLFHHRARSWDSDWCRRRSADTYSVHRPRCVGRSGIGSPRGRFWLSSGLGNLRPKPLRAI